MLQITPTTCFSQYCRNSKPKNITRSLHGTIDKSVKWTGNIRLIVTTLGPTQTVAALNWLKSVKVMSSGRLSAVPVINGEINDCLVLFLWLG